MVDFAPRVVVGSEAPCVGRRFRVDSCSPPPLSPPHVGGGGPPWSTTLPALAAGRLDRSGFLRALVALAWVAVSARAEATDYASAGDVFDAVDRLEADVEGRLRSLAAALPAAQTFVQSLLADYSRHRSRRARLRRRLGLPPAARPSTDPGTEDVSLDGLHTALEALVYAHAEGMPAQGDPQAVEGLARDMVDLSRHLTVVDLWIEEEAARG